MDCETGACPACAPGVPAKPKQAPPPEKKPDGRRGRRATFDVDHAARLYRSGMNLRDVAEKVGSSAPTVRRAIVEAGVALRPKGRQAAPSSEPWPEDDEFQGATPDR